MSTFLDFIGRAIKGPVITEKDFNMKVLIPNIAKTVKKYNIKYDPNNPVITYDDLADRLYNGAIEFLVNTGIYCVDTNRIISFSRDEVVKAVEGLPKENYFGEGYDRGRFRLRKPEDDHLPWFHVGTGIVASTEDIAMAQVEGYGSIAEANSISIPALSHVNEMSVLAGSPLEIYATIDSIKAARKALAKCGRIGLPIINLISSAATAVGTIAGTYPAFGLRQSDGWLIDPLAEMKINFDTLNQVAFLHNIGANIGSTGSPVFGGYAGGPEGTALLMTTYIIIGKMFFKGSYHLPSNIHFRYGCNSTRPLLWVFSVVGRATSRNILYPAIALGYASAGPCTKQYFYEAASINLCCVVSGYAGIQTVHPAKAVINDGVTPIMKAGKANEIVIRLLEKYEKNIEKAPQGKIYQECFDVKTRKPKEEYIKLYDEVKDELTKTGIPF